MCCGDALHYVRRVPLSGYQKEYGACKFEKALYDSAGVLLASMRRFRSAAHQHALSGLLKAPGNPGTPDYHEATGELLAAVLSGQLLMCRVAVFFPWKKPFFFAAGRPSRISNATGGLAEALLDAWEILGIEGVSRRQITERLIFMVGQQTAEAREQLAAFFEAEMKTLLHKSAPVRCDAALRENYGESCTGLGNALLTLRLSVLKARLRAEPSCPISRERL